MALTEAREDLRAARKLARGCARTALEAVILNNLGIAERQLNCFGAAKAAFHEAERLLTRGGEGKSLVKIACNLAVIAAQEGDRETAAAQTGRAARLIRRYPGDRLEFFVSYSRGVVAQLLGDPAESAEALSRALPAGKRLGDRHLVGFGEVLLAEANLACGRYAKALAGLRRAARMNAPPLPLPHGPCAAPARRAPSRRPAGGRRCGPTAPVGAAGRGGAARGVERRLHRRRMLRRGRTCSPPGSNRAILLHGCRRSGRRALRAGDPSR
jgi:hypothetical protein